ncbi:MAG: outer membrane lipoprotein-sorting protein [Nitrospinaceae bacterium]
MFLSKHWMPVWMAFPFLAILILIIPTANGGEIDANKLLAEVDDNLWSNSKYIEGRLIIDNGRRERVLTWETRMEGVERSYSYYKSPPRDKGTKMLKIKSKLWMYTPRTDRKILIAGHLLRQSMMGSDLSYEDMMEDRKLSRAYEASLEKMVACDGVRCGVLFLVAHDKTTTYQTRRLWVDPERKIVLKEEMYAKGGKLLKKVEFMDYRPIGNRLFPKKMIFRDMLKENTKTTYIFDVIQFDVEIPEKYFSQAILKR